jgi:16S rRNA (cytidine1402-2'-O)-methyltransferase
MEEGIDTAEAAGAGEGTAATRSMPASLYVVATPLGNARDLTLRALDILRTADLIAAEDTRVTAPFLRRHGIAGKLVSMHAHNEARRAETIVAALNAGKSVALVSDAGTPAISDPGARLVRAVSDAGYRVVPIPGPSAVAAAVSVAGLDVDGFVFLGFLPTTTKARRERIATVAALPLALVIYEAPHRVRATVAELAQTIPGPRTLVVARELTKAFETIARIPLAEAATWLDADPNRQRGELVLIVDAPQTSGAKTAALPLDADRWLRALLDELPPARAARVAASVTGVSRDELYARALALKRTSDE